MTEREGPSSLPWQDAVLAALAEPLRAAGMSERPLLSSNPDELHVMWHVDAASPARPCPDSPVWERPYGCYDVTVQGTPTRGNADAGITLWTEGALVLSVPFPDSPEQLRAVLEAALPQLLAQIPADFAAFETENDGYFPGTEPRP